MKRIIPKGSGIFFWALVMAILWLLFFAWLAWADEPKQKSYFQFSSSDKVLTPGSIWNPVITEKDGKVTKKSYFQFSPDDKVLVPGSIWNPLVTEKKDK